MANRCKKGVKCVTILLHLNKYLAPVVDECQVKAESCVYSRAKQYQNPAGERIRGIFSIFGKFMQIPGNGYLI